MALQSRALTIRRYLEAQYSRLVFMPVRDRGAEPQGISVAVDAARPPGPVVKLVAERLVAALQDALAAARAPQR